MSNGAHTKERTMTIVAVRFDTGNELFTFADESEAAAFVAILENDGIEYATAQEGDNER